MNKPILEERTGQPTLHRMERLDGDIEAMESHGNLADELREIVCTD